MSLNPKMTLVFSEFALVFEISVFFIFGKKKIVNLCICHM